MSDELIAQIFHLVVSILTLIIGSVGNILMLVIVAGRRRKSKNSVHDILITNLALADFLWVTLSTPTYVCAYFKVINYSQFYCKVVWPVMTIAFNADILTVTSMAIHRCHAISNPWKPKIKARVAVMWALGTWTLSLIITLPVFVVTTPQESGCYEVWSSVNHRRAYTASLLVLQYILPLLIIASSYATIAVHLRRLKFPGEGNALSVRQRTRKKNLEAIKVLAAIVITFAVFMLPGQIVWMLFDFGGDAPEKAWFSHLYYFSDLLAIFHSCLNPLIYGVLNKKFRREYGRFFARMCCCCRFLGRRGRASGHIRSTLDGSGATNGALNDLELRTFREHQAPVLLRFHELPC